MYTTLDEVSNSKDFMIEGSKSKAQEPKVLNLNNFLYPNLEENIKTFDKAQKKKKKY